MKKSKFLLLFILICCTALSVCAFAAEADSVLSVGSINIEGESLCFGVVIGNEGISYESAYTVVSVYDKDGGMLETSNKLVTYDEKQATVEVGADFNICSYQVMLLSSDGKLKPLCASVKNTIDLNELEVEKEAVFLQNIDLLSAMDIINVNGLENASPLRPVTRAEFAAVLCRAMDFGLQAEAFRADGVFDDVASDHWAAGYINFLAHDDIIDGADGKFMPDEAIAYNDALKAIVYALGYEPMETVMGGYKQIAKDRGITSGLSAQEYVTVRTLSILINNTLTVPKLEPTSIGDTNTDWEIMDGTADKDYLVLLGDRNVHIATGVVMEVYGNEVYVMITEDSQDWEFEYGDELSFNVNDSDIGDYLFQNVNIYVEEISRRNYNVIAVMPAVIGETLILNSDMVESVNDTQLSYYTEGSSKKTIKYNIETIVYNGVNVSYDMTPAEIVTLGDVSLKFIENTGDTKYDALIAEKYTYAPVDEVDAENGIIIIDGDEVYLEFEDEEINIELINSGGTALSLDNFVAGDTVAYVSDGKTPGNYSEYLKIVNLYDNMIKGTVDSLDAVNGIEYVIIDGVSYQNNSGITYEVGVEYTFCIGMTGKIVFGNTITEIVPRPEPEPEPEPEPTPEEAPQTINFANNMSLLSQLGITNVNGLEKAEADHKITGAEFAALLTKMAGFEAEAELFKGENTFSDVPSDHWAAGYINLMAQKGVLAGNPDGSFCPDEAIDYADSVKGVVRMLGFEPLAKVLGGNPVSYVRIGKIYGITDHIVPGASLTADSFATLAVNAISSPVMEITGLVGEEAEYEVLDGKKDRDYASLLTRKNIFVATGIVLDSDVGYVYVTVTEDSDDWEFENGDEPVFKINGSDILDYQFQNVDVYVEKDARKDYNVVAVVPGVIGETFTLLSDDVKSASASVVEYYVDPENSSKTKEIKLDLYFVVYNKALDAYSLNEIISTDDVELTFIENTGDSRYDVLVATKYTYECLELVEPDKNRIALGGRTIELDFEDEEMIYVFKDDAGNKLKLSDFSEGDVVAYYGDYDNLRDASYIELVKIKNNTLTGMVESVISSNGYEYLEIEGKKHINNSGMEFDIGETYKFYIGVTGKIVYGDTDLSPGDGSDGDDSDGDDSEDDVEETIPAQTVNYAENVKILSDFDIINVNGLENADPSHEVTNGELAAVLVKMLDLESEILTYDGISLLGSSYSGHWAEDYINLLIERGIIDNGDIDPDAQADYIFAVKSTVRALGFEPLVQSNGGTILSYIETARAYGVTKDIEASSSLTADTLAALVSNALTSPVMKAVKLENGEAVWEVLDGKKDRDYETLLTKRNVYMASGIVMEFEADGVYFMICEDSDDYEFEEGDEVLFEINGSDIVDYMFQNVNVYVNKDAAKNYNVISVSPGVIGEAITLISDDVRNVDSRYLEYYVDSEHSSETRQLKLDYNIVVYYNMQAGYYTLEDVCCMDGVELKFIENTGDTTYDVVVATNYVSGLINSVDAELGEIIIGGITVTLDFEDTEKLIMLCDNKGNRLELKDFVKGDIVSVVADSNNIGAYNEYIKIIKLTDAAITGMVEETYTANGTDYVVIDGKTYSDRGAGLSVGKTGVFYLDMNGNIVFFEAEQNYGYILESAVSSSAFSSDSWQIKLLTEDNGVVVYDLTDDANEEYDAAYGKEFEWYDTSSSMVEADANLDKKRFITYKLNSKGQIKSFEPEAHSENWHEVTGEYNAAKNSIGEKILEEDTAIFAINAGNADDVVATDVSGLIDETGYMGAIYENSMGKFKVMVIVSGDVEVEAPAEPESKYGYILESAYSEGSFASGSWQVRLLTGDEGVVVYTLSDSASDKFERKFSGNPLQWSEGTIEADRIIEYTVDSDNCIDSVVFAGNQGTLTDISDSIYSEATLSVNGMTLEEDAVIFVISEEDAIDNTSADVTCLVDNTNYTGAIFADSEGKCKVMLVRTGKIEESQQGSEGAYKTSGYAYVLESAFNSSAFSEYWQMKLLLQDGSINVFDLSDDANYFYEENYNGESVLWDENKLDSNRFIYCTYDSEGVINSFSPAADGVTGTFEIIEGSYKEDTLSLAGKTLEADTTVFYLCVSDPQDACLAGTDYFVDDNYYKGAVYSDENGKCRFVFLTEAEETFENNKGFAIVTRVSYIDYNGDDAIKIKYIQDETEGTVIITDDSECITDYDCDDLYVGSVFMYTATPKGVVNKYAVIADIYNGAIKLCGDIHDVFDPDMFYGDYIANEARKAVSAGEVIELSSGESVVVTENTNKYTYNDAGRNIVIEIGDFLAGDAYYFDSEWGEFTPVIVKMFDGEVIDIYTSNQRQMMEQ